MTRHGPRQQLKEAKIIAKENGMFIVDNGDHFLLYRETTPRNVYLGRRNSPASLRSLVLRCAGTR